MTGNTLLNVVIFSAFPMFAAIVGASMAAYWPPNATVRSYIQHLAAGVVFSVVAVELLPEITARHKPLEVAIGFALGVIAMLGIRQFTRKLNKHSKTSNSAGLLVGVGIDTLLDGLLIGISFAAGTEAGQLLTIALAIELLSLGLVVATTLSQAGASRKRIIVTATMLFALVIVGAVVGIIVLQDASNELLELVLSFGLAALLYLVTEELLVEAHEEPETPIATAIFFAGFLLFLILGMLE